MSAGDTVLTLQELDDLYEVLSRCQQVLKHQEQAAAALQMTDKPAPYSPLVEELMRVRNDLGEKVAIAHAQAQQPGG